jgi:hypothetical protein
MRRFGSAITMRDVIEVRGPGVKVLLGAHPVTCAEYRSYLRAIGRPPQQHRGEVEPSSEPVTGVSQEEALAFCGWAGPLEQRAYRLPTMAELSELMDETPAGGVSQEVWPHHHEQRAELRGGFRPAYLCEWTSETETVRLPAGSVRVLGSVFYPPWLRHGPNACHLQACLLASEGYPFVTFRLAVGL